MVKAALNRGSTNRMQNRAKIKCWTKAALDRVLDGGNTGKSTNKDRALNRGSRALSRLREVFLMRLIK